MKIDLEKAYNSLLLEFVDGVSYTFSPKDCGMDYDLC